jgi:hypothetical protein
MVVLKPKTIPAVDEERKVKSLLLFVNVSTPFRLLNVIVKPDMLAVKNEMSMSIFEL